MADSLRPLLDRSNSKDNWNSLRKCASICHPVALFTVLVLCVTALIYPFWNNGNPILSTASHPFINTERTYSSLHSLDQKKLSVEALSDLVSSLPGLDSDTLDFAHYSGYVDALEGRQIHYWFFEAQSDPQNAPLFFWTNGGPGCSGLCGLLTEHGPFWSINDNQLLINEYSWNNEVNIVYFEQPYGVGFSTVDSAAGLSAISGDAAAVADFDAAVRSFITKFPMFLDSDIYLSSESFGGHYMPLTALQIMKNNELELTPQVHLKGFMVGNPYTNYYENTIGAMEAFYGHGLMRNDMYETWRHFCFGDETAMADTHCKMLYMVGYYEADNTDHYALDFDYCPDDISWEHSKSKLKHRLMQRRFITRIVTDLLAKFETDAAWESYNENTIRPLFSAVSKKKRSGKIKLMSRSDVVRFEAESEAKQERRRLNIEWALNAEYYPCAADLMTAYLNQEDVQSALHVNNVEWGMCNNEIFAAWPDSDWDNKMQPYYAQLAAKYPELKILVFSGDDDSVCGLHGTQYWLDNMDEYGWSVDSDNEWIPWQHNEQLAGYQTTYLTQNGDVALYFYTVRSAGHMVPQTQPSRALALLRKFLDEME